MTATCEETAAFAALPTVASQSTGGAVPVATIVASPETTPELTVLPPPVPASTGTATTAVASSSAVISVTASLTLEAVEALDSDRSLEDDSLLFPTPEAFWVRTVVARRPGAGGSMRAWQVVLKRGIDLVVGTVLLLICLPVLAIAALAIKLDDGGPVFFRQTRVGHRGRPFTIWKLRTMVPGADQHQHRLAGENMRTGPLFKMTADPRVTSVGQLLRKSSMDEIPQLLNVLAGSMSLVGPRPALHEEVAHFDTELMRRLDTKPGLTGLWQVEARDDPKFERYQTLDLYYVRHQTLQLDLAIMLATPWQVLKRLYRSLRMEASLLRRDRNEAEVIEVLD